MDAISAEGFTDIDIGEFPVIKMFTFEDSTILLENYVWIGVFSKQLKVYLLKELYVSS